MAGVLTTLQIKVTLDGIRPPIWRRIVVLGSVTLGEFHRVLQVAMGWEDYHLHCFRIGGVRYGPADDEDLDLDEIDEKTVTVAEAFSAERRGMYDYDFGDSWEHRLLIEKTDVPVAVGIATCIAGKRACPPEDCGGVWGYYNLIEALGDPAHEEHDEYLEWAGEDFDPEDFSKDAVNAVLERQFG